MEQINVSPQERHNIIVTHATKMENELPEALKAWRCHLAPPTETLEVEAKKTMKRRSMLLRKVALLDLCGTVFSVLSRSINGDCSMHRWMSEYQYRRLDLVAVIARCCEGCIRLQAGGADKGLLQ